jgi:hypothetical protein
MQKSLVLMALELESCERRMFQKSHFVEPESTQLLLILPELKLSIAIK